MVQRKVIYSKKKKGLKHQKELTFDQTEKCRLEQRGSLSFKSFCNIKHEIWVDVQHGHAVIVVGPDFTLRGILHCFFILNCVIPLTKTSWCIPLLSQCAHLIPFKYRYMSSVTRPRIMTQNKTLRFSKHVKLITIMYGGIPQQVLFSKQHIPVCYTSSQTSDL